jgi:hypothetical protein
MNEAVSGHSQTRLHLLTRDGAIAVTFSATLTPEQYEEVYNCVSGVEDAAEMKECLTAIFGKWGIGVEIEKAV